MSADTELIDESDEEEDLPADEAAWYQSDDPSTIVECVTHQGLGAVGIGRCFSEGLWFFVLACLEYRSNELTDTRSQNGLRLLTVYVSGKDSDVVGWDKTEINNGWIAAQAAADELGVMDACAPFLRAVKRLCCYFERLCQNFGRMLALCER